MQSWPPVSSVIVVPFKSPHRLCCAQVYHIYFYARQIANRKTTNHRNYEFARLLRRTAFGFWWHQTAATTKMALENLFWLILLIVVIYLVVRKIRNEAKVKNGRTQLAGKVRRTTHSRPIATTVNFVLHFICVFDALWHSSHTSHTYQHFLQVVVITGASSGIGEALAHEFYAAGCRVVLASRRVGELERVRNNLLNQRSTSGEQQQLIRPDIVQLDLANVEQLTAKCEQILNLCNHVDILINNGGVSLRSDTISVKTEVDIRMMYTNYFGAVTLTKG